MISFRFHLASLAAIFCALAIGVVVGSTLIDRAIVDGLESQVGEVRDDLDDRQADITRLEGDVDRLSGYVVDSALPLVQDRLRNEDVVVLAERGVDEAAVRDTVTLVQQAGARAPGIVWLEPRWALADGRWPAVGEALGLRGRDPGGVRRVALSRLASALASEAEPEVTSLVTLADQGLLSFEARGDAGEGITALEGLGALTVVVTGTDSELATTEPVPAPSELVGDIAEALTGSDLGVLVAEVHRDLEAGPERGASLEPVATDDALLAAVVTVDDLDLVEGRVAVVLALADLDRGVVGRYGYGAGSETVLPLPPDAT